MQEFVQNNPMFGQIVKPQTFGPHDTTILTTIDSSNGNTGPRNTYGGIIQPIYNQKVFLPRDTNAIGNFLENHKYT
jgi:hypothetical protein